ncbi:hypothetical protein EXIGLDRAFT_229017 [Exidia glandulosa HHB12029]|uniref:Uncharacterized protein n=1 Tax=Exidia glandulosa HHB12029 TaxID=1314781 RepID=A0A165E7S0_EXIGL|nr:hypothetical protein EXIGLDRAFT_229017 [Exidia glandulosa HHB12029]
MMVPHPRTQALRESWLQRALRKRSALWLAVRLWYEVRACDALMLLFRAVCALLLLVGSPIAVRQLVLKTALLVDSVRLSRVGAGVPR